MDISTQLFEGQLIYLSPINHEKDAETESKWTHDPEYLRMLSPKPARPLSPAQVRKKYEAIEKEMDEGKRSFYFTIRKRGDDRLIGFIKVDWVDWTNGNGFVELGIGEAGDREHGYGGEALRLVLRYAFAEINLFRLSVMVPAYNQAALRLFTRAGFVEEVRRREALQRNGRYWDFIHLGLLREEWEAGTPARMSASQEAANPSGETSQKASLSDNLFSGSLVRLGMDNPEELANAFSCWRRDSEYYRLLDMDPVRLFSVKAFQKDFEANLEKKPFDDYLFTIHALDGDRLIGFIWLGGIDWNHGNGWVGIGLGERDYWGKGYGTDAMRVVLRYGFRELNLHRVSLNVFAYNPRAIRSYEKAGFQHEGRIRQALCRDGERADDVWMGILKDKWEGSE